MNKKSEFFRGKHKKERKKHSKRALARSVEQEYIKSVCIHGHVVRFCRPCYQAFLSKKYGERTKFIESVI